MVELNTAPQNANGKPLRKKANLRVDLTAMVDLAFLLVTFFMLTTTLSKPHAMDLAMPVKDPVGEPIGESRTVTLCLGKNNKVLVYQGMADKPLGNPEITDYSKAGLRKVLLQVKQNIYAQTGKSMVVLVKPSDKSVYGNLVDVLDELHITQIPSYAVEDITAVDINLLKKRMAY
ncbi:biopolymer transporter ExbD [Mucilaginibacter robiniae]|uniref:Biopolymer transporter ExbD n=1 Tax=Mucilaginibacter robiniae TaxID=2728022 RepID=A0A7L5E2V9_9SPHI|nr:biopolymer transporter ExbD [Mucilaginibacter robiniae]QJD94676.1 biopolymer transporter ExbD [Mucilaginibacter robiniae]